MKKPFLLVSLFLPIWAFAQTYSIDWHKIAGGGGTSTGGAYSVSGTIGQPDASGAMSGGGYSLTGGFWGIISMVQAPGVPLLAAAYSNHNVIISWAATGSYTLVQSPTLAGGIWATNLAPLTTTGGTNYITISPTVGNLFFRLKQ